VIIRPVKGKSPLEIQNEKKFKLFVEHYREDIVDKWINFFVYNKEIKTEIITKKVDSLW